MLGGVVELEDGEAPAVDLVQVLARTLVLVRKGPHQVRLLFLSHKRAARVFRIPFVRHRFAKPPVPGSHVGRLIVTTDISFGYVQTGLKVLRGGWLPVNAAFWGSRGVREGLRNS